VVGPVLVVGAAPDEPASIPTIFRSDNGIRRILEHPPVTRHDGFNILTYERAQIVEGEKLAIDAWRKRVELYKDGTFFAIGTFADLLGWPRDGDDFARNPKVNSLALIEFTYDVFKTYEALLDYVEPLPLTIRCTLAIEGAYSYDEPVWMAPYALGSLDFEHPYERRQAPADSRSWTVEVDAAAAKPHIQPGRIAFDLIEQLYNWFGIESDKIPYASLHAHEIDPATF
jgi:hypothetical protein